jgi:hypothetical protein
VANKISYAYANSQYAFSTAAELRDALLASYPGAAYLGAPIVLVNRDDPAPAWGWVRELLRTRTDWWPALGIALQHAAQDGGDNARIALADLLEGFQEAVVLLEWTEGIAKQWPDAKAGITGTSLGRPDYRLETIVAGQRKLWNGQQGAEVSIEGLGPGNTYLTVDVKTAADLEALLATSAKAGGDAPWSWLFSELLFHHRMQPWVPAACAKFAAGSDAEVRAMLDWFSEQHDLWRYVDLLEAWSRTPPPWWSAPAAKKHHPIRGSADAKTLGDVASGVLSRALGQAGTSPTVDLVPISNKVETDDLALRLAGITRGRISTCPHSTNCYARCRIRPDSRGTRRRTTSRSPAGSPLPNDRRT